MPGRRGELPNPFQGSRFGGYALAALAVLVLVGAGGGGAFALQRQGESGGAEAVRIVADAPGTPTRAASRAAEAAGVASASPIASPTTTPAATELPSRPSTPTAEAASAVTPSPSPASAPRTPTASPTAPPAQAPPSPPRSGATGTMALWVQEQVGVGQTLELRVSTAAGTSASAQYLGGSYPLVAVPGGFWGLLGMSLVEAPGPRRLTVTVNNPAGVVVAVESGGFEVVPVERPVDYLQLTEQQASVLTPEAAAREVSLRGAQFAQFDTGIRWAALFSYPIYGIETTAFGQGRSLNGGPVGDFHTGEDLANDLGTPVQASAAGRVTWAGEMPIRGNSIVIDHGAGVKTGYHHLHEVYVNAGDLVTQAQVIGAVGSTGLSTGPHLHWELTIWGVNVDPVEWTRRSFSP